MTRRRARWSRRLRTTLDPLFERALDDAIAHALKEQSWWQHFDFLGRPPSEPPSIVYFLELHDPRAVSRLSIEIRRGLERRLAPLYGSRGLPLGFDPIARAERLIASLAHNPDLAILLTTHSSGYVREAAVRSVRSIRGAFSLALLVHRLNDWVDDVALAAERKLEELEKRLAPKIVADCIEHLWGFDRYERATERSCALVAAMASRADVLQALRVQVWNSVDDHTVRLVRFLLRRTVLDGELEKLATTHISSGARALAMRALLRGRFRWPVGRGFAERAVAYHGERRSLALMALKDRWPAVNAVGVEWVVENRAVLGDASALLQPFALHRHQRVASLAQFGLQALGVDWLAMARAALRDTGARAIDAARVLGAHGNAADGEALFELAADAPAAARFVLLGASARLKNDRAIAQLLAVALRDPDPARARRAALLLAKANMHASAEDLYPLADRGAQFLERGLWRLAASLDVAAQLEVLCRLERARADFDLDTLFARVRRKMGRAAYRPSSAQRERLNTLLPQCPRVAALADRFLGLRAGAV